MTKQQRKYFIPYNKAYKRAQYFLILGIIGRIVLISIFVWLIFILGNASTSNNFLVLILAIVLFVCCANLCDQIIGKCRFFDLEASNYAFNADPRALAAHQEASKASFDNSSKGANALACQIAYDTALLAYIERNPTYYLST